MRECPQCKQTKEPSQFRVPNSKRAVKCLDCLRHNDRLRSQKKHRRYWSDEEYRQKNLRRYRYNTLVNRGVKFRDRDHFHQLLEREKDGCEICGSRDRLAVDHNHSSGEARGILCQACNHGIGNFAEDVERLKRAILYLQKHETVH